MGIRETLESFANGRISAEEAEKALRLDYLERVADSFAFDGARSLRKGVPEIVYAAPKSSAQLAAIAGAAEGFMLFSKVSREHFSAISEVRPDATYDERSKVAVIGEFPEANDGTIGIISAGTSDIPVAEEARLMAAAMGVSAMTYYDVGVAGAHRLATPLSELESADVAAIVVAAGMEGTLPTLVSSLTAIPVIGLPVSTGYGIGGAGAAALLAMLQSCSPGLTVVNVDNGIGAGAAAATIALRRGLR